MQSDCQHHNSFVTGNQCASYGRYWMCTYACVGPNVCMQRSAHNTFLPSLKLFTPILQFCFFTNCSLNRVLSALYFAVCVNLCGFDATLLGSPPSVIFKIGEGPGKGWSFCFVCLFSCSCRRILFTESELNSALSQPVQNKHQRSDQNHFQRNI